MQLTKTEYNQELLEKWQISDQTEETVSGLLSSFLMMFNDIFKNTTRVKNFAVYIRGLLSNLKRKSIEPIALEHMGESGVRTLQNFITRSNFDDEKLLCSYQLEVSKKLSVPTGMLSLDGSEFSKKGKSSAGVKRQYCGRLGKVENCQAVVFAAYAGSNGYGIIDRELYIPKEWFDDEHKGQCKKCQIPDDRVFKTKNEIAKEMITSITNKNLLDIKWIGCDAAFGCDHNFVDSLPGTAFYFVGTNCRERVFLPGETLPIQVKILAGNDNFTWTKVGFDGSKGVNYSDVKIIRCFSCRSDKNNKPFAHTEIWLYIRRYQNGDIKYSLSNAPGDIPPEELHGAATLRWPIEQCFEECKSYLGMADFEGRSYNGFLRHLLFVMIAHFFGTYLRIELKKTIFP